MLKALLCDKEPIMSKLISREITWLGQGIFMADNGLDGLRILQEEKPDLLITDIFLPLINGFEFISQARKINPEIIIVVYSDVNLENLIEHVFRLGANDFIVKPFDPAIFNTRLKRILLS